MNAVVTLSNWLKPADVAASEKAWVADLRQQAHQAFNDAGLPTRKNERWKYADLSFLNTKNYVAPARVNSAEVQAIVASKRWAETDAILLVTVNGHFMMELSDVAKLPAGMIVMSLSDALVHDENKIKQYNFKNIDAAQYPFAALNTAHFGEGVFIEIPEKTYLSVPIHLLSIVTDENEFIAHPRRIIHIGKQSKVMITEEFCSTADAAYFMNIVNNISLDAEAELTLYQLQHESKQAVHMSNTFIDQYKNSTASIVNITTGGLFSRDDVVAKLKESGAACHASGYYQLFTPNQYVDHHLDISHQAPRSNSEMLYKGIVDHNARAVFNGRLHVQQDAQRILAYQANHNLLLSPNAEVYSKPELEIYADDVKCKHGATTGQLDQDAMFYLRSRGIRKAEALAILLQGFADDVLKRITHPATKKRVKECL